MAIFICRRDGRSGWKYRQTGHKDWPYSYADETEGAAGNIGRQDTRIGHIHTQTRRKERPEIRQTGHKDWPYSYADEKEGEAGNIGRQDTRVGQKQRQIVHEGQAGN